MTKMHQVLIPVGHRNWTTVHPIRVALHDALIEIWNKSHPSPRPSDSSQYGLTLAARESQNSNSNTLYNGSLHCGRTRPSRTLAKMKKGLVPSSYGRSQLGRDVPHLCLGLLS